MHSKVILNNSLSESEIVSSMTDKKMETMDRSIIEKALLTDCKGISRLNSSKRDFPLAVLIVFNTATANVLVLIPPPVEPGEAPTHIRNIMTNNAGSVSAEISTVLNPAVRGVTEPKNEVTSLPKKL
jgi:hypothetical protein